MLAFGGRADDAAIEAQRAVELDPQALYGHWVAAMTRLAARDDAGAIEAAGRAIQRFGRHALLLMGPTLAHARLDHLDLAQALVDELIARSRTEYVQEAILAVMAMAIGRRDEAVKRWIDAVDVRDPLMVPFLLRGPIGAELREQPEHRFALARVGWERPLAGSP